MIMHMPINRIKEKWKIACESESYLPWYLISQMLHFLIESTTAENDEENQIKRDIYFLAKIAQERCEMVLGGKNAA